MSGAATQPLHKPRLAVVLSHPTQYYSPWFRSIAETGRIDLRVFYLSDFGLSPAMDAKFQRAFAWDVDLVSGYEWEMVPNLAAVPDTLTFSGLNNPDLPRRIRAWRPDAVLVFGYKYRTHLRFILGARAGGARLIFRGDSHLLGQPRIPLAKRILLGFLYRQFASVTYVGAANRDYFLRLGVPERRLFFAPHAVDSSRFTPTAEHMEVARRTRRELQIPAEHRVILFSGKWIHQKQPAELLRAFVVVGEPNTTLLIAGDGPERDRLHSIARLHPHCPVRFLPFANQSEMPARYLTADIFALPSTGDYETWGLAVNEAMHMGLPCLVSDRVGCQRDLVHPGVTGWVCAAGDQPSLTDQLRSALTSPPAEIRRMAAAAAERVSHFSYQAATRGLVGAIEHAVGR